MSHQNTDPVPDTHMADEEIDAEFDDADDAMDLGDMQETDAAKTGADVAGKGAKAGDASTLKSGVTAENTAPAALSKKDKTLEEMLELVSGDFAPIIPDAVTDYYLSKNGFSTADTRVKRLLALATQKFVSDIAQDAYEFLRIRSSSAVYNSANPQLRAKQLLQSQQFASAQGGGPNAEGGETQQPLYASSAGNQQGKIVLTMEDLSNALSEYGVNTSRPDFYR